MAEATAGYRFPELIDSPIRCPLTPPKRNRDRQKDSTWNLNVSQPLREQKPRQVWLDLRPPFGAPNPARVARKQSVEIERGHDRVTEGWLLTIEQHTDLLSHYIGGNGGDVVAAHDRGFREAVRRINAYLAG